MAWSFNPYDHYWTVTDTDPSTHVFSSALWFAGSTPYVVLADSDYVDWLADGGQTTTIATDDELKLELARILLYLSDKPSKPSCRAATTANITLSGEQTVDGVALVSGDRCLVLHHTTLANRGIYVVSTGTWSRATDANTTGKIIGATVYITEGDTTGGRLYVCAATKTQILGTHTISWYILSASLPTSLPSATPATDDKVYLFDTDGGTAYAVTLDTLAASTSIYSRYHQKSAPVQENGATHSVAATTTHLICNRAGTITVTLPSAASYIGREITIQTWQAQAVESAASDVVAPGGGSAGTAILAATAGKWATLVSNGTYWYVMSYN